VNRAGGLIYSRTFTASSKLQGNDYLRLASTFHSLFTIASQTSPVPGSGGITSLDVDTFALHCFQSLTGVKFFVTCDPGTSELDSFLRSVYILFSDYALKNPFYELDQVVHCQLFDYHLGKLVESKYS
jgi:hypothetical protein